MGKDKAKIRPIPFSDAMVRALLKGEKTQTRRIIKRENKPAAGNQWRDCVCADLDPRDTPCVVCEARFGEPRYGPPGDRLWVKEAWRPHFAVGPPQELGVDYRADDAFLPNEQAGTAWKMAHVGKWRSPRFMPQWASRILLEITQVYAEHVWDITEEDARAETVEGCALEYCRAEVQGCPYLNYRNGFRVLWDGLNLKRGYGWDTNPAVWVYKFKVLKTREADTE